MWLLSGKAGSGGARQSPARRASHSDGGPAVPRMSAEQRAELERQLAEDDQAGDESAEDFEVDWWEETPDGHRRGGRMPWSHAKRLYGQWAPDVFGEAPEPASGPQGTGKG